jgi:D-arabinose 1-dehydrogenase-like Zn-dependent alcohol dehydrogenase
MELEIVPLLKNNIRLQGIYVGSRAQLAAVVQAVSHHRIKPVIDRVYRFDQARDALARLGDGSYVGKLVVAGVA